MSKLHEPMLVELFYQSFPLPSSKRSIRVLKLEAFNPGIQDGGPLHGDIQVVDLDTNPAPYYTALSYVCGSIRDAAPRSTITLGANRFLLQLTDNCYDALKQLRSTVRPLTIWVDAICIHQEDSAEKTHQIALMGDVYKQAHTTFIWLGPGDDASDRAMQCLAGIGLLEFFFVCPTDLSDHTISPKPWHAAWSLYSRRSRAVSHLLTYFARDAASILLLESGEETPTPDLTIPVHTSEPFVVAASDIVRLLSQEHMNRLWTYQEVMLSRDLLLVCGNKTLPWWRLVMSTIYLQCSNHQDGGPELSSLRLLKQWISLARDRSNFQMTEGSEPDKAQYTTLVSYEKFLSNVAEIMSGNRWQFEIAQQLVVLAGFSTITIIPVAIFIMRPHTPWIFALVPFCVFLGIVVLAGLIAWVYEVANVNFRIPQRQSAGQQHMFSSGQDILAAIWSRQCSDKRDVNFGTRNILKAYLKDIPPLDYSVERGEAYRDLTANTLRHTQSSELILAALRSNVPGAPSWTVDWFAREPLRLLSRYQPSIFPTHTIRIPAENWMHNPLEPNALHIRGRLIGAVSEIIRPDRVWNLASEDEQRFAHIRNIHAFRNFYKVLPGNFRHFLSTNRSHSSDWIVQKMLSPGSSTYTVNYTEYLRGRSNLHRRVEKSTNRELFDAYTSHCAEMKDRCVVMVKLLPAPPRFKEHCAFLGKLYSTSLTANGESGDNMEATEGRYCRIRPGDKVLDIRASGDVYFKAVVRDQGDHFIFIDAVETEYSSDAWGMVAEELKWYRIH